MFLFYLDGNLETARAFSEEALSDQEKLSFAENNFTEIKQRTEIINCVRKGDIKSTFLLFEKVGWL